MMSIDQQIAKHVDPFRPLGQLFVTVGETAHLAVWTFALLEPEKTTHHRDEALALAMPGKQLNYNMNAQKMKENWEMHKSSWNGQKKTI